MGDRSCRGGAETGREAELVRWPKRITGTMRSRRAVAVPVERLGGGACGRGGARAARSCDVAGGSVVM